MSLIAHLMEISIKLKGHEFEGLTCFQIPESSVEIFSSSCGSWMHFSLSAKAPQKKLVGVGALCHWKAAGSCNQQIEFYMNKYIFCSSGVCGLRFGG